MPTDALPRLPITPDACYLALKARDARFDGRFFTGVTSTGIYCRPVCSVRAPRRENCRFFGHAALAESAGFRPCLRCRPELAPQDRAWSIQDASGILAQQAARMLDEPDAWGGEAPSVAVIAARMGISDRHLRRIFEAHVGVSPLQYLQTRRLLTAKQLLADTNLPIVQVALISGFASLRRFNAACVAHYRLSPSALRKDGKDSKHGNGELTGQASGSSAEQPGAEVTRVRLGYRPPYDVAAMLGFWRQRRVEGVEQVTDTGIARTVRIAAAGSTHTGWIRCAFDEARSQVLLEVSDSLRAVLPLVIRRVRATLDLDADPITINAVLHSAFPAGDGLRVPGSMDGFELAVRAVLGQQITVAAARTLAQRLVGRFGEPIATPHAGLTHLFPSAAVLASASGDALGQLGIVRQRQGAIVAMAQAVVTQRIALHAGADVQATVAALKDLPGIGDWTAQYIAMRALRWPDAFPAGDVALHKALGVQGSRAAAKEAEVLSQPWRPWRSYAVLRAWYSL